MLLRNISECAAMARNGGDLLQHKSVMIFAKKEKMRSEREIFCSLPFKVSAWPATASRKPVSTPNNSNEHCKRKSDWAVVPSFYNQIDFGHDMARASATAGAQSRHIWSPVITVLSGFHISESSRCFAHLLHAFRIVCWKSQQFKWVSRQHVSLGN